MTTRDAFAALNRLAGIAPLRCPSFEGDDPIMATPFRVGSAAAMALGLGAAAANEIWRLRGGSQQDISIDLRAAAASLVSFALLRLNGEAVPRPSETKPTVGLYRTGDGRWIHLHGGFPR
ncbi:MAG: CoA transferase, partial [Rhizomicrobium sp.]